MDINKPLNVLVFSKTSGYRHDSISAGMKAIKALVDRIPKHAFTVTASEDAEGSITPSSLKQYAVVILLQCTGDFLTSSQLTALRDFSRAGGGIVAIHGAAAGMLSNDWYGSLIGVHFDSHPDPEVGTVYVENGAHCIINRCGGRSGRSGRSDWMDEWYNFTTHPRQNANLEVLLKGDTTSFAGGKMGDDHPLAWCQELEGGRVYYTALGHFAEAYEDAWFMDQIYRGILWAARVEGVA